MTESIKLVNIRKIYGNIVAVDNFNFCAKKGEIIALLGPNGAGKSTLMNMITGFLAPSSGQIFVDGLNIADMSEKAKEKIGFLSEGSPLYPDMSVKMFLKYMADLRNVSQEAINRAVKLAKIDNVLNQKIETLSKGYLRRVGFAQSILSNPDILLLDEPTDGLDPNQKSHMRELISQMGKDKTIIISTHLLDEAETVCNRIVLINKGKIMADGTCKDILKKSKTKSLEEAFAKLTISNE
ncbi:MAG: ABC transporter ATP-binding protein [Alphaproteobacteria bacterium]|nr:ABC transporter ATP-binding protein [Alphaproteobacteria bacterium]